MSLQDLYYFSKPFRLKDLFLFFVIEIFNEKKYYENVSVYIKKPLTLLDLRLVYSLSFEPDHWLYLFVSLHVILIFRLATHVPIEIKELKQTASNSKITYKPKNMNKYRCFSPLCYGLTLSLSPKSPICNDSIHMLKFSFI